MSVVFINTKRYETDYSVITEKKSDKLKSLQIGNNKY